MRQNNFPSNTIEAITDFLFIGKEEEELVASDLVIVLGNDQIDGTVEVLHRFWKQGIILENAKIILSGATGALDAGKDLECNRLYDCAVQKYHMPGELFVKEAKATNACENFQFSKELVEQMGGLEAYHHILCVGKAFLLRRAAMYAARFEYPEEKMQYFGTVDINGKNIGKNTWWQSQDSIQRVLAEIKRIGEYGMSGDLSIW